MPITSSATTYGAITKSFHWLTALLILTNLPLGWFAAQMAEEIATTGGTEAQVARAALLFSIHKTTGVTVFFVALARILWALTQTKPGLLNGDRPLEAWAAETVHWLLYGSLVAVPLSGWVYHAATTGFAPIWWPFGQDLPFVPKSEAVSEIASTLHFLFILVLAAALAAHVAGALKHHLLDGDATLRRMLPGDVSARPTAHQPGHTLPLVAALAVWAGVVGGAGALGWFEKPGVGAAPALTAVKSDWQVQEGSLEIAIRQMGSQVTGRFAEWTADIAYAETADAEGRHGTVEVVVAIPSLTLGSVTKQAMGPDFFNADAHPTATFAADLISQGDGHVARGTLTIKGQTVPVEMPFTLDIEGDTARASGGLIVDRRDFGIGEGAQDPGQLGFEVEVSFDLVARRADG
ncbi:cytochrome [Roseovarius sp. A46]|uniref:cytochrome b/b6 domain-containing protein n=1 Tax=Roseovarius sp. A46 TaxID=2109331 RepID=UPI0010108064|nr:cytochrome b/b6 domain-containing protein [Roseovarius sp. A46]RXV64053.1 cytochrome [Roseovarius sp. A46]